MGSMVWVWTRGQHVTINGEVLQVDEDSRGEYYVPFELPNLPNALARVDSPKAALRFARTYGLLGYSRLVAPGAGPEGDPIPWVLAQGSAAKFALLILEALANGGGAQVRRILNARMTTATVGDELGTAPGWWLQEGIGQRFLHGSGLGSEGHSRAGRDSLAEEFGRQIVARLVNGNTTGIRRSLEASLGEFVHVLHGRALVEAIWWLVGEAAAVAQDGNGRAIGIRICEDCRTPFLVEDRRQRFCPGDRFSKKSLCGARHRKRRAYREKKGEEA